MPTKHRISDRPVFIGNIQRPLSRLVIIAIIGIAITCAVTLIALAFIQVSTAEFGYTPHILIFLLVGLSTTAALWGTDIIPWRNENPREWARPRVLGFVIAQIVGSVQITLGIMPTFVAPVAQQRTLDEVLLKLDEGGVTNGERSLIERHIGGIWGEQGCDVTYAMTLKSSQLKIESKKILPGMTSYSWELRAEPGIKSRLAATVIRPLEDQGHTHEFIYERIGDRDFLTWVIKRRETSLRLDRCDEVM